MRYLFGAILIALAIGTAFAFVPFHFPFFLLFILIFFVGRWFFFPWRRRGYYCRPPRYDYHDDIIPIDGYQRSSGNTGPERKINVD
jgi:hypothetical protein